jgi:glutamine synthetase
VELVERERRQARAQELVPELEHRGVVAVATSFVDNSGITRVKAVPLARLPVAAAWGVGVSTAFDFARFDDWLAAPPTGEAPVGDQRLVPDLDRLVALGAQPGWAWAPGELYLQTGDTYPLDSRALLKRVADDLEQRGLQIQSSIEIEWVVSQPGDQFVPAFTGPAYGFTRLIDASEYGHALLSALQEQGVRVAQFHPEVGTGQLEVSVTPEPPLGAADTSVLVRATIRAVGAQRGLRTSFSPKVDTEGVGNGGHLHLGLRRDGRNLMAGGTGWCGLTDKGTAFAGGILEHLPGLLAIGCPSVVSYLRLVPEHFAGAYQCWGLENREAALRMVTGSVGSEETAANLEVKCFDLHANPYLMLAGVLAAGMDGLEHKTTLPEPVNIDPAALDDDALHDQGIRRLPTSLRESTAAFVADEALTAVYGTELTAAIEAIRQSELELLAGADPERIVAASLWAH